MLGSPGAASVRGASGPGEDDCEQAEDRRLGILDREPADVGGEFGLEDRRLEPLGPTRDGRLVGGPCVAFV